MVLQWGDPPAEKPRKVDIVAAMLRTRPGQWALIDNSNGVIFPWYGPLYNDKENFEFKFVYKSSSIFGPRDVYARYIGKAPVERPPEFETEKRTLP